MNFPSSWNRIADPITGQLHAYAMAPDTSVIREATGYRMYFTAYNGSVTGFAMAESTDGLSWKTWKKPTDSNPLVDLALAPTANFNVTALETVCVMKAPNGQYRMYYAEDYPPDGIRHAIGLATSPAGNGTAFTRYGSTAVFKPVNAWEKPVNNVGGVLEPSVLYDPAVRKYKMWYVGCGMHNGFVTYRIGYATSNNGIGGWARHPVPVLDVGPAGSWDSFRVSHVQVVADPVGGYHMVYHGGNSEVAGAWMQPGSVGHAFSTDGIKWQRNPANPILTPRSGKFDAQAVTGPNALFVNGKLRLYYTGFSSSQAWTSNVGVVEAA